MAIANRELIRPGRKASGGTTTTRQRVVAGARKHFFAYGFRAVTMDDLAEELGMSKKTLYVNFASKTLLLEAVLADKFDDIEADLSEATRIDAPDIESSMRNFFDCLLRHFQEIQAPFVRDADRSEPQIFHSISIRRRKIVERHFGKMLGEGRKKGIIRDDIPPRLIIEILLETIDSVINPRKILELKLTPGEALSIILKLFLHGLLVDKNPSPSMGIPSPSKH
jgi:AcrR family transcriptional regulator